MGSSLKAKSTRARVARSAKSTPKPRRRPVPPSFQRRTRKRRKGRPCPLPKDCGATPAHSGRERRDKALLGPHIPEAVEAAIHEERATLITSITLLFSLHSILRRQLEGLDEINEPVESAEKWVNVTELTTMLLGKLSTVLRNLDAIALGRTPDVDPEDVEMTESVAEMPHGQRSNS